MCAVRACVSECARARARERDGRARERGTRAKTKTPALLFVGHTLGYDATHPSATTPAQRLSRQRRPWWGRTRIASCRGSAAIGRARSRSAALGCARASSRHGRSIDRLATPAWPSVGEVGWGSGARTAVSRDPTRRAALHDDDDDDEETRRRDGSRIFFFPLRRPCTRVRSLSSRGSFDRPTARFPSRSRFRKLPIRFVSLSVSLSFPLFLLTTTPRSLSLSLFSSRSALLPHHCRNYSSFLLPRARASSLTHCSTSARYRVSPSTSPTDQPSVSVHPVLLLLVPAARSTSSPRVISCEN